MKRDILKTKAVSPIVKKKEIQAMNNQMTWQEI